MAIFLNNKVGFKIATIDLSDHVTAFSLNRVLDQIEISAMGDTSHKFTTGLSADQISVSFLNDNAASGAGSVRATLQAAFGTTVAFSAIQDSSSAVSTTNPLYTGTILIDNLNDINGAVADEAMMDITFTCNSKTVVATTGTW
ncbi:hypothetical protein UFOVP974_22 [uncultured Caudovirales phage]|uniref:Uncharacterized protein n=2 Tax=uncultured Caudovirales phage TaxID=2100421 RepID=A0A6J5R8X5_9CAUD|nr:hypothetical protein UFOVP974_22 [uncultured Caudovirales phage]CAB4194040.1 hypothetical protein UFOVP1256_10 [uncultured Caudovirales phage]